MVRHHRHHRNHPHPTNPPHLPISSSSTFSILLARWDTRFWNLEEITGGGGHDDDDDGDDDDGVGGGQGGHYDDGYLLPTLLLYPLSSVWSICSFSRLWYSWTKTSNMAKKNFFTIPSKASLSSFSPLSSPPMVKLLVAAPSDFISEATSLSSS